MGLYNASVIYPLTSGELNTLRSIFNENLDLREDCALDAESIL